MRLKCFSISSGFIVVFGLTENDTNAILATCSMTTALYTALSGYLPAMAAVVIYEIAIFAAAAVVTAVLKFIPIVKKLI